MFTSYLASFSPWPVKLTYKINHQNIPLGRGEAGRKTGKEAIFEETVAENSQN
jgi:hypothetical protein